MKNKYSIIGCILIFIATVLIFGSFSYGTIWITYIGRSATYTFFANVFRILCFIALFIIGVIFVRKGKEK